MLTSLPILLLFGLGQGIQPPQAVPTTAPVMIKRQLTAGEDSKYDFCCAYLTHRDVPGAVPNSSVTTWMGEYKIASLCAADKANLAISVTDFWIDGTRPLKNKQLMPSRNTDMIIDERGKVEPAKSDGPENSNGGWFVWESIELPGKAVATGETWLTTFPHEAVLHSGEEVPVKLLGSVKFNNHDAWALSIDARDVPFTKKFKANVPSSKDKVDVNSEGVGSMHIDLYVDQATGKYLFVEERLHTVQTDTIGSQPKSPPLVVDFTATMRIRD